MRHFVFNWKGYWKGWGGGGGAKCVEVVREQRSEPKDVHKHHSFLKKVTPNIDPITFITNMVDARLRIST